MPTPHTRFSYTFGELDEKAKEKALAEIGGKLTNQWWDDSDNEEIGQLILNVFAEKIGTPGVQDHGVYDFPGITGVTLEAWSCSYIQGDGVGFSGDLTRENAPNLLWVDGIESVTLESGRYTNTSLSVETEPECICDPFSPIHEPGCEAHTDVQASESDIDTLKTAIQAAIREAHQAGYKEIEYRGSTENARQWIDGNEPEFNEDGSLF